MKVLFCPQNQYIACSFILYCMSDLKNKTKEEQTTPLKEGVKINQKHVPSWPF